jgi:hypothetical protein
MAQVNLMTAAYLNLLPKPAPEEKPVDKMTWAEWKSMWDNDDGRA